VKNARSTAILGYSPKSGGVGGRVRGLPSGLSPFGTEQMKNQPVYYEKHTLRRDREIATAYLVSACLGQSLSLDESWADRRGALVAGFQAPVFWADPLAV